MNITFQQNFNIPAGCNYNSGIKNIGKYASSGINKKTSGSDSNIPASVYKANYLPSFGRFKKVRNVYLRDKDTGKEVPASLQKDNIGDFVMYRIMVNRENAGFLNMQCDSIFPEGDCVLTEPDNNIPEVKHLRSILGDKYSGIGTELMYAAVDESKKRGKRGALWLHSEQGYESSLSKYRSNENPIPFYYKLGFKSLDKKIDDLIKKGLETSDYGILPSSAILLLPSDKSDFIRRYYASNYSYAAG